MSETCQSLPTAQIKRPPTLGLFRTLIRCIDQTAWRRKLLLDFGAGASGYRGRVSFFVHSNDIPAEFKCRQKPVVL